MDSNTSSERFNQIPLRDAIKSFKVISSILLKYFIEFPVRYSIESILRDFIEFPLKDSIESLLKDSIGKGFI